MVSKACNLSLPDEAKVDLPILRIPLRELSFLVALDVVKRMVDEIEGSLGK
ncbi:hypothetical protein PM082_015827 [Marasmius tenuissimus]|nr:hypothetical protein PM082_015827 [Marasmius tenuissimus]